MDIKEIEQNILHSDLELKLFAKNNCQSQVFQARFKNSDNDEHCYVLKIYDQENLQHYKDEVQIIQNLNLKQFSGFPKMVSFMSSDTQGEILFEKLGKNLKQLLKQHEHISRISAIKIILQLLQRIEDLHSQGIAHHDLKLENIVIGSEDPDQIYLIDFGISQFYIDKSGKHIQKKNISRFTGNILFASINGCRGNLKSRKDDLESLVYLMGYLLNETLPWMNINEQLSFLQLLQIRQQKSLISEFIHSLPKELYPMMEYIYSLKFDENPNYKFIRKQLQKYLNQECQRQNIILDDHRLEWVEEYTKLTINKENVQQFQSRKSPESSNQNFQFKSKVIPQNFQNALYQKISEDQAKFNRDAEFKSLQQRGSVQNDKKYLTTKKSGGSHYRSSSRVQNQKSNKIKSKLQECNNEIKEIQESEEQSQINKQDIIDRNSIIQSKFQNIRKMINDFKLQQEVFQKQQYDEIQKIFNDIQNNNLFILSQKDRLENYKNNEIMSYSYSLNLKYQKSSKIYDEEINEDEEALYINKVSQMNFNFNNCKFELLKNKICQ